MAGSETPRDDVSSKSETPLAGESPGSQEKKEAEAKNRFLSDYGDRIIDGKLELPFSVKGIEYKYVIRIEKQEAKDIIKVEIINVSEEKLPHDPSITRRNKTITGFDDLYKNAEIKKVLDQNAKITPEQRKQIEDQKVREELGKKWSRELKKMLDEYANMDPIALYKLLNLDPQKKQSEDGGPSGDPELYNIPAETLHAKILARAQERIEYIEGFQEAKSLIPVAGSRLSAGSEGLEISLTNMGNNVIASEAKWDMANDTFSYRICQKKFNEYKYRDPRFKDTLRQISQIDDYINSAGIADLVNSIKNGNILYKTDFASALLKQFQKAYQATPFPSSDYQFKVGVNNESFKIQSKGNQIMVAGNSDGLARKIIKSYDLYDSTHAISLDMKKP